MTFISIGNEMLNEPQRKKLNVFLHKTPRLTPTVFFAISHGPGADPRSHRNAAIGKQGISKPRLDSNVKCQMYELFPIL